MRNPVRNPVPDSVPDSVLDIAGLHVSLCGLEPVRGISLQVTSGETHGLVGESGCGKSLTALAIMGLLPPGAVRRAGRLRFLGQDLLAAQASRLRGDRIGMIFQEPMTSLDPAFTIGAQLTEVFRRHRGGTQDEAMVRAAGMLARVGVSAPSLRLGQYPHHLSGGLRQRVMIAMALICGPALLIADEPTTALDVTVQAGILRLLRSLQATGGLGILLITHDLGVVARTADRVSVMYAGEIVEQAPVATLFARPAHPYTQGLLASVPVPGQRGALRGIPGAVPRIGPGFIGCAFRDRCPAAMPICASTVPLRERGPDHTALCHLD